MKKANTQKKRLMKEWFFFSSGEISLNLNLRK